MYSMRKRMRDCAAILGLWGMIAAPYASAVVTPVPSPVVGNLTETWEAFPNYVDNPDFYLTDPTTIMGGGASISNPVMAIYEPELGAAFGLGDSGLAQVSDGTKGMGLDTSAETTITFTKPVFLFGAFWGAATGAGFPSPATVTVSFYDAFDQLIDTEPFTYVRPGDGLLEWHGWQSTNGIKKLTYTGDFVVNDGLQASTVPEPGTLALTGIGLLGLLGYGWQRQKHTA